MNAGEVEPIGPDAILAGDDRARLERNIRRTLVLAFFEVFLVIMPIAVPFFQSKGLSMGDVFTLQALFALVVLLAEVPSGYIADLIGRKQTIVVGAVFAGIGNTLLLFADGFWTLALFEAALAISHSLVSGADLALVYDSELALGRDERSQRQVVGRLFAVRNFSEAAAGVACSLILFAWTMDVTVWVQVVIGWIPLALACSLSEPPVERHPCAGHLDNLAAVARELLASGALLRLVFVALCIWSLTTFYSVWLIQKLWETQGVELVHFGYLWGALAVVASLSGRFAHVLEDRVGPQALLLFIGLAPAFGYLGLAMFGVVGGLIASTLFFAARGIGLVILRDALNRRVSSRWRATANSLASCGFRAAFVVTGPFAGVALDLWGMTTALIALAVVTLVIFVGLIVPLMVAVKSGTERVEWAGG
jgi:MFS family permease